MKALEDFFRTIMIGFSGIAGYTAAKEEWADFRVAVIGISICFACALIVFIIRILTPTETEGE